MFGIGDALQIGKVVDSILDKFVADKSERDKLKAEVSLSLLVFEKDAMAKGAENVKVELSGQPFQRNWRPLLMYMIISIIGLKFLLFPLAELTPWVAVGSLQVELPQELFTLMEIGIGGYIAGRSLERISHNVKDVFHKKQ